ncbi:PREDICTED: histone-lysine N-methyltransferase, H3 lysine-9 specific SUVH3-like [Tarenaya hassleriana]|uniref:histone-lysine N-methyltransferase, H3 lysine-9 specific SUVH3-like n=1 Tax=Tarenaya hassleriana TaxID=28532 RepID=UPI00053C4F5A|nr:PREDICTED: histone-lysine N-methyltransferase, H3 lysine-9 specific SUVH3-like [Tarenaya hassleriana]XP_010540063.1 PREDICTED: histone-lysine N-methyltransferase, H3 lysine-9 specific SUVH3-like [Tarenaya hassleriana]XP_010540064.1 PREDICTED: histone-lysine N-methyltransferase, H3 lysine-9 specific SUVH3-like [Tarenaya hassleriana]XP_010540065.1 PREDICTED: histone-lysine N-methyltransferase, H3 lysine-9 specific SUVH3-like [Tarenaya hassleriana]
MGGGPGLNTVPNSNRIDKSRVLDVKPLRSLEPVFPNANQGPPFVCCPPFGPFTSGFSPFFPFGASQSSHYTPDLNQTENPSPAFVPPLRSFREPTVSNGPSSSGGLSGSKRGYGRPKGSTNLKKKEKKAVNKGPGSPASRQEESSNQNFDSGITVAEREDGNREIVLSVLARFDAVKRRLNQLLDAKHATFKSAGALMSRGVRTNMKKRVGSVPGVEVGDIFYFRIEMCLVGLHMQTMAGIDYLIVKGGSEEDPLATSIVSSGHYDDDAEDPDSLIYSGQGGNADKNRQASDQKLERGNLALERSLRNSNTVRVIRGVRDVTSQNTKIYIYDGLFSIKESWVEKGKSGCNTFKYKLARLPGQPPAFAVWKSVQKWREGLITRTGLILPDLTSGAESVPVSLINDVDDDRGPAYFTYISTLKYSESFRPTHPTVACTCRNSCAPGNLNCSCIRRNEGDLPYVNGTLVSRRPMIYECGPTCPCNASCKSKIVQTGLKLRLEVFKTENRGWGLRSWDPIRAGSFICEYAGELKDKAKLSQEDEEDEYIFDTSRAYNPFRWNYEPALVEEYTSEETLEEFDLPSPLVISAKSFGNVARFMNHSCSPNVLWQPVVYECNGESFIHIAFFAIRHIPPLTELTYDYGFSCTNGTGAGSSVCGKRKCLCGYDKCRGSFS